MVKWSGIFQNMVKTASLYSRTYIYGSEVKRIYTDRTANMYGRKEKTIST